MGDKPGFDVYGTFYPSPASFRLGDTVLVTEVTGLDWEAFTRGLDEQNGKEEADPIVLLGLLAVAVWQGNPRWRRAQVIRHVEAIPYEDVRFVAGDELEVAADSPPAEDGADGEKSSRSSAGNSPESLDMNAEPLSPISSGLPGSATGFPA